MYDYKKEYMLTTIDNPFNPFTQFDSWYQYDEPRYHTCEYIARLSGNTNDEILTDEEIAMNSYAVYMEILKNDFLNIYRIASQNKKE